MRYRMRIQEQQRRQLRALLSDMTREQGCFLVCGTAQAGDNEIILLVREVLPLSLSDLRVHAPDQLSVEPSAMLRAARRARSLGGSLCMVHTHPMSNGEVAFSTADDYGNFRTFEFFERVLPGELNSCLVWDSTLECVQGRVYTSPSTWYPIDQVEVVSGERRVVHRARIPPPADIREEMNQFDRQARLLGLEGQRQLGQLKIGFIGCGGIGSVAAVLCAHSGLKEFTLVDFDTVSMSNLPRILGATPSDVGSLKIDVVRNYINAHKPDASVYAYRAPVEAPGLLPILANLDAVICGTDDTTSRAFLNQLCHQYNVPILDMGVQFAVDPATGELVKEVGRVNLMLPGSACLACSGQIDPVLLQEEGLAPGERERRMAEGYIVGVNVPEPSMMMFNMQVAARGVQQLIAWVTGLAAPSSDVFENFRFLGLNAATGIKQVKKYRNPKCSICGAEDSIQGLGDRLRMLVGPRSCNIA